MIQPNVATCQIQNGYAKDITIKSGEFQELNNRVIRPGFAVAIQFTVPEGFKEYVNIYEGPAPAKAIYLYVGIISDEF